ncbi:MAG TPA: efflux RND transporter periplasmic adaptor subunit [Vicinamibacterales bacterium]|nr:efflux RND transporter periplasmic adaptor subunit [Vicinamibacterales bacterium]
MERDEEEIAEGRVRRGELRHPLRRRLWRALLGLALVAAGLAAGVVWSERHGTPKQTPSTGSTTPGAMPAMPGMPAKAAAPPGDEPVEVSLTPEAVERAGIKTTIVGTQTRASAITVPGTVTTNAYRDTKVNSLVGGVVREVSVDLGASVTRGQPLAVVFSAELAEAQMKYRSVQAMFEADHQKLVRTEKLVALGAASRQELEEVTAAHAGHSTEVASARQRLLLLGLSAEQVAGLTDASHVVSDVVVRAPGDGVVIARSVNPGQVVGAAQELFVVTDLRTVWVIGDLYEKDFASIKVGSPATIAIPSRPGAILSGRVAYIDPRVDPATRTAKVRVEVPNRGMELRLGMYVTLDFRTGAGVQSIVVPREAVQAVGDRNVVYVPVEGDDGRFAERPVKLGAVMGDSVQVLEGVKTGDRIVTTGSFFLRGEAARSRSGG